MKMVNNSLPMLSFLFAGFVVTTGGASFAAETVVPVTVTVDGAQVIRQMAGGIGASWHAVCTPGARNYIGSGWGGNPSLADSNAWAQLERHASWLGLDFVRVEVEQRMFEPARGRFDWENEEMRTLYRILDWCEAHHADVFLQHFQANVAWNALPGAKDPANSAPKSLEDFVEGMTRLVEHLIKDKRYTCIRWFCLINEPPNCWQGGSPASLVEAFHGVRAALDAKGISLPLAGPDWVFFETAKLGDSDPDPWRRQVKLADIEGALGAFDIHVYGEKQKLLADAQWQAELAAWTALAHTRNKPFFLSEFGVFRPGPRSYEGFVHNATAVLRSLNVGVDGLSRWSFVNRGDIDGQWQMVRTWDIAKRQHLPDVWPEPFTYHGYGLITRLAAKHSTSLACRVEGGGDQVLAAALRSPKGNLTLWLLNLSIKPQPARIAVSGLQKPLKVFPYQVTQETLKDIGFILRPGPGLGLANQTVDITLPPTSFTALSSFKLQSDDPGITEDE